MQASMLPLLSVSVATSYVCLVVVVVVVEYATLCSMVNGVSALSSTSS